jgi:hypothetical protein
MVYATHLTTLLCVMPGAQSARARCYAALIVSENCDLHLMTGFQCASPWLHLYGPDSQVKLGASSNNKLGIVCSCGAITKSAAFPERVECVGHFLPPIENLKEGPPDQAATLCERAHERTAFFMKPLELSA